MIKNLTTAPTRSWRWLRWLLGLAILAGLIWHWSKLATNFDWEAFAQQLRQPINLWRLVAVLLLMPINWLLETRKFQLFVQLHYPWSFWQCWRAVLVGIGASSFTPNRLGEIGGRAILAKKEEVAGILIATLQSSLCQWLAFLMLAWPGLIWVGGELLPLSWQSWRWYLLPLGPLIVVGLIGFGLPQVHHLLQRLIRHWRWSAHPSIQALKMVKAPLIIKTGTYACLRFVTYCTQIYLLLQLGGLILPYWYAMAGIAGVYLLQAGIPLPPGINLLVRAELASLVFGNSPEATAASLAAFGLLFVVNILLPTLPALWLLVKNEKRDEN
ncbi:MAG: lysylphosphatidylglycerol synthase domain-containing protein [Bacteroidota bacterium]